MTVDVVIEDDRWEALDLERLAERAVSAALAEVGLEPAAFTVSLMGCDDARIAALNADFRGRDAPTNVLSWPSQERGAPAEGEMPAAPGIDPTGETELGDVALAWDTCEREAAEARRPMRDHVSHLIVHGTLHLLGYDHERDGDAALMEGLEREILGKLGLPDPYG